MRAMKRKISSYRQLLLLPLIAGVLLGAQAAELVVPRPDLSALAPNRDPDLRVVGYLGAGSLLGIFSIRVFGKDPNEQHRDLLPHEAPRVLREAEADELRSSSRPRWPVPRAACAWPETNGS